MNGFKERAFLVCRASNGKLSHGPVVEGKPGAGTVKMPDQCPTGTKKTTKRLRAPWPHRKYGWRSAAAANA